MREDRLEVDEATLRLNLWLTQGIVMGVAVAGSLLVLGWEATLSLFILPDWDAVLWAVFVAAGIIIASIAMDRYLLKRWQDDGSINEKVFGTMLPSTTILVCMVVGVGEEWLFRGVIQSLTGNFWSSLIFTLIHIRYLKKPLMIISVFGTSLILGLLFSHYQSLWPSIVAHILIDVMLAFYLQKTIKKRGRKSES
ncbi:MULTISPECIES: CPBP family intramembrane glutamic endopeptidase [Brevibacillus]|uniref:CPBP family intramembrane glutamic endopeptidase n=1 Tax=Brevibacillus TaxID=55080 RepID=UPI000D0E6779|nr:MULTISPECIES: CPBP family intramembrane glutamic endopeptidase [Brevibacillus]MED1944407.1 CPBP family intramembrane metalloprotease [Brevibacillus formosus]MED1999221.1 CPBP family intramembrane metalloprotease [Brevibacillus formosus]MED2082642.1 CPBP family intramembrane metalloprotease [Brevibacillus formosus]PSK02704.1 CPBP family intramembrane metalloprotease [Brevibacillus sp. NRRL NRS-603]